MEVSEGWCEDYDTVNVESCQNGKFAIGAKSGKGEYFWLEHAK